MKNVKPGLAQIYTAGQISHIIVASGTVKSTRTHAETEV